jgi:hypothetical protein
MTEDFKNMVKKRENENVLITLNESNDDLISVKEYAERVGKTRQAVLKEFKVAGITPIVNGRKGAGNLALYSSKEITEMQQQQVAFKKISTSAKKIVKKRNPSF